MRARAPHREVEAVVRCRERLDAVLALKQVDLLFVFLQQVRKRLRALDALFAVQLWRHARNVHVLCLEARIAHVVEYPGDDILVCEPRDGGGNAEFPVFQRGELVKHPVNRVVAVRGKQNRSGC